MSTLLKSVAVLAALTAVSAGCAEPETPGPAMTLDSPPASTVFSPRNSDSPLPVDEVFIPDVHIEDDVLFFRIQVLPGYYLYKDKLSVRSLSADTELDEHDLIEKWSTVEVVIDEWFGEQEVVFNEAHGAAGITRGPGADPMLDIELSYQGCKKDGLCYLPQAKVLSIDFRTPLESAADETE